MTESDQYQKREKPVPKRDKGPILSDLTRLTSARSATIALPRNKAEMRKFGQILERATQDNPLRIYVGSCPDYATRDGMYSYEALGSDIPLLTRVHLQNDEQLLAILDNHNVPYELVIMVADIEGLDDYFCQKYTAGSQEAFMQRCMQSAQKTQSLLDETYRQRHSGVLRSSTFLKEFGVETFLQIQKAYQATLTQQYQQEQDDRFHERVRNDTSGRMHMYHQMYKDVFKRRITNEEFFEFCAGRTIRTMAQYLTLGRLIASTSENAIMINHPTRNLGTPNERNRFPLPGDGPQPHPTIPIFEMKQGVYS